MMYHDILAGAALGAETGGVKLSIDEMPGFWFNNGTTFAQS
jgi:hypothetical protein